MIQFAFGIAAASVLLVATLIWLSLFSFIFDKLTDVGTPKYIKYPAALAAPVLVPIIVYILGGVVLGIFLGAGA